MRDNSITITVTDENFECEVLGSKIPFIVNLRAEWSGPCHIMTPVIEELALKFEGQVKIGDLDVDNNTKVPDRYGIRRVPFILFFDDGKIVEQIFGAVSRRELSEKIISLLQKKSDR